MGQQRKDLEVKMLSAARGGDAGGDGRDDAEGHEEDEDTTVRSCVAGQRNALKGADGHGQLGPLPRRPGENRSIPEAQAGQHGVLGHSGKAQTCT